MDKKMETQLLTLRSTLQTELSALSSKLASLREEMAAKQSKISAINQLVGAEASIKITPTASPNPNPENDAGGGFTPVKFYWRPILEALIEIGGKGRREKVIALVGEKMRHVLTPADRQRLPNSTTHQIRWENRVAFQISNMKTLGLVSKDSPRGIWEITPDGRNWLDTN